MSNSDNSAGVYNTEVDRSFRARMDSWSTAVIIGESLRGTVNARVGTTSKDDFRARFGKPNPKIGFLHYSADVYHSSGGTLYTTRVAPGAAYAAQLVRQTASNGIEFVPVTGLLDPEKFAFGPTDVMLVYAENPGEWGNGVGISIRPDTLSSSDLRAFYISEFEGSNTAAAEFHASLGIAKGDDGEQLNVESKVSRSSRIRVRQNLAVADFNVATTDIINTFLPKTLLTGGTNGNRATAGDFIRALSLYENADLSKFSMIINNGLTDFAVQSEMDRLAEFRNCIAIIDMPQAHQQWQAAVDYRRQSLLLNSKYSAIYSPDVLHYDTDNDIHLFVPVSGYVAAAYASVGRIWDAPAGTTRGALRVKAVREIYNQPARNALDDHQINPIRVINTDSYSGIAIWGADTTQTTKSANSSVPVRRMMGQLENALNRASMRAVFEPSDQLLWTELWTLADGIMRPIQQGGGVYWYNAVCDESVNTPDVTANGDVVLKVFIDPTLYAKRILIQAVINRTGVRSIDASYAN